MIREMTLGQYYKADSILHKLDPRVKLLGTLLFVITLFFPKSLLSLGIATAFLILIVKLSSVYDDSGSKAAVYYHLFFSNYKYD